MRIAFFNWRDIRNPMAGGAEVLTHQLLRRLVSRGHKVTLFASSFKGSPSSEVIDGVEHIRYGGRYSMYALTSSCYRKHVRGRYDVIVESINGVPFFTPLFAKERVVTFIHQLTRENWYSGLPLPLAFIGFHAEDLMLSFYKGKAAMVPSESTRQDLLSMGFKDVRLVHEAVDISPPADAEKEIAPTFIYLGRLTKSKRVDHALRAFKFVKDGLRQADRGHKGRKGQARLWIAGSGPEERRLRELSRFLGISDSVEFFGKVDEGEKARLLSRAHIAFFPAVREGWGLVVLEANACGTPVIGYDVHGLRDSIIDNVNGFIVPSGDFAAIGEKALSLSTDRKALSVLSDKAKEYSRGFSWDRCADDFMSVLESV